MTRPRFAAAALLLAATALPLGHAHAEPPNGREPALECAAGAKSLNLSTLPAAKKAEVDERFKRGVEFYQGGDYKLALIEFERVYQLAPNYKYLYNIGQVNLQLNNYAKAYAALQQYLCQGGAEVTAARRAEVVGDIASLKNRTARISVRVQATDGSQQPTAMRLAQVELLINDLPVTATEQRPLLVDAGSLRVVARRRGFAQAETLLSVAGADERTVTLTLEKINDKVVVERTSPAVYVGWGTTGALGLGWGVTALLAGAAASDLSKLKDDKSSSFVDRDGAASRVRTFALASDVLGGATLVAAGVSLYLTLRPKKRQEVEATGASAHMVLGPASVGVAGKF